METRLYPFCVLCRQINRIERPVDINPFYFKSKELYDGVFEYKDEGITVELVEGIEYT